MQGAISIGNVGDTLATSGNHGLASVYTRPIESPALQCNPISSAFLFLSAGIPSCDLFALAVAPSVFPLFRFTSCPQPH